MRILQQGHQPKMGAVILCFPCLTRTLFLEHELKATFPTSSENFGVSWHATCPTCKASLVVYKLDDVSKELEEADAKQTKDYYEK